MLPADFSFQSTKQCSVNKPPTGTPSAVCCLMEIERFRLNYHVDKMGIKKIGCQQRESLAFIQTWLMTHFSMVRFGTVLDRQW